MIRSVNVRSEIVLVLEQSRASGFCKIGVFTGVASLAYQWIYRGAALPSKASIAYH